MRRVLVALLMAATGIAHAENAVMAFATTEPSNEWRVQHGFSVNLGRLAVAGFSNIDAASSGTLNRFQIKPRVSLGIDGPWRLTLQEEWFWSRIQVPTPRGEIERHVRFDTTRIGIGRLDRWEGLRNEFNLYLHDTQASGPRVEMFTSAAMGDGWSVNNQFWRDFSGATSFNQVSLQWQASPAVSVVLQHNVLTGKAPVYRVGVCVNF